MNDSNWKKIWENANTADNSNWKTIWNNRNVDINKLKTSDEFTLHTELKKLNGFDVQVDSDAYYKNLYDNICLVFDKYIKDSNSVFEVGCGSGANLLIFKNRGLKVGGIDYSNKLSSVASEILNTNVSIDEAINLDTDEKYDVVISDSVFAYFKDEEYAKSVLDKMYTKANKRLLILDIFDSDKYDECLAYRRSLEKDYDVKYAGLDKTSYSKQLFIDFAKNHNCDIEFFELDNSNYWNNDYTFNCVITKK